MRSGRLVLNATALFLLTAVLEMTLHEGGHFAAGLLRHDAPVIFHNYVRYEAEGRTVPDKIITSAAGPLTSLLLGMVAGAVLRRGVRNPFSRLFWWLFAVSAYIGFFGYLFIAPFFSYGDTGYVLRALGCPMWGIVALSLTAILAMYFVFVRLARYPVSLMSGQTAGRKAERRRFVASLVLLPLLCGIPLLAVVNLPSPTFLSLLAPLMSPWSVMYAYGAYLRSGPSGEGYDEAQRVAGKMPWGWFAFLAVVVLVNRLLVYGVSVT